MSTSSTSSGGNRPMTSWIDLALARFALQARCVCLDDMKDDARILLQEAIEDGRGQSRRHRFGASDAQFPGRGVGQELDVLYALPQLIEDRTAAGEERAAIHGRLDALWASIEEAHPERVLQIRDCLRHYRVRDGEMIGCFRNAAVLNHREQDMEVAQLKPAADAVRPFHRGLVGKRLHGRRKIELSR